MENKLALIEDKDLSLVENNSLNALQLKQLLKKTPAQYVKSRPAKGGGQWSYVTGGYIKKVLNIMFGWDWDFEIVSENIYLEAKEVVVKGRLTCRTNGKTIVKMQYGNKDIMCRRDTGVPLSIGNDFKAAATDALKKCAAEIGIAADIYNAEDFMEINVTTNSASKLEQLKELLDEKAMDLTQENYDAINNVINNKERASYDKAIKILTELQTNND